MRASSTITLYTDTIFKIIQILQQYTASLDNFEDIEEIVNIIHYIQKEVYKSSEEE